MQLQIQQAEIRKQVVELESQAEDLRLARLQERLEKYREAAEWDWAGEQLGVARGLASNTHAVVQVGPGDANDIARAFLLRDIRQEQPEPQTKTNSNPVRRSPSKNQLKNNEGGTR